MAFFMAGIPVSAALGSTMTVLEADDTKVKLFSENGDAMPNPLIVGLNKTFPKVFVETNKTVKIVVQDKDENVVFAVETTGILFNTSQQSAPVKQERFEQLKELLANKEYSISQGGTGKDNVGDALVALIPDTAIPTAQQALQYSYAKTEAPDGSAISDLDQLDEVGVYKLPTNYTALANKPTRPTKANENDGVYCIVEPRGLHGLVQRVVYTKWSSLTTTIPKFFMRYAFPANQSSTTRGAWSDWYAWGLVPVDGVGTGYGVTQTTAPFTLAINSDAVALRIIKEDIELLLGNENEFSLRYDPIRDIFHVDDNDYQYLWRPNIDIGEGVTVSNELLWVGRNASSPIMGANGRQGLVIL